ncbi:hypothetical protein [Castellaniella sp.]|uniref:hypothetical protein n=1 Tax=Castellaniella sp. TaxID=1955812 RepID=UPI002B001705|nr:hypothetical protein [Castellaniella sp.]
MNSENDWDTPLREGGQTYREYLDTIEAYHFCPASYKVWAAWQRHYAKVAQEGAAN